MQICLRAALFYGLVILPVCALAQPADVLVLPETTPAPARQVKTPQTLEDATARIGTDGGPTFQLNGVALVGATVVRVTDLEPIWRDLIGQDVSVSVLNEVAERISAAYRARGFFLSQAVLPAQTVTGGTVRFIVIEGFIGDISLARGPQNQQALVARHFEPVAEDRPLRLETLERGVSLSRNLFGRDV